MRRVGSAIFVLALAAGEVRAAPSVSVRAGAAIAPASWRTAPSMELDVGAPLGAGRLALDASFAAWTLAPGASIDAQSEIAGLLAATWRQPLGESLLWSFGAGPALRVADGPLSPPALRVGAGGGPGLSMRTRRESLTLDLSARAYLFTDGLRFSFVGGATYSFR